MAKTDPIRYQEKAARSIDKLGEPNSMIKIGDLFAEPKNGDVLADPRRLFTTLNRHERFKRPSDEQGEVLDKWYSRRTDRDVTIKMNTGSGKTLVGLLILASSLSEKLGPAIYVVPDNFLARQVIREAQDIGIRVTDNEHDAEFLRGESVLVVNIKKLFNGRSVFGVHKTEIPIGTIVIDDAHACLEDVQEQFTINIPSSNPLFKDIISKIDTSINDYDPIKLTRIKNGDPAATLEVPYWIWKEKSEQIYISLLNSVDTGDLGFKIPLIIDILNICQCVLNGKELEISPRYIPADVIPAFFNAERKIFMTATLANDGVLVSHLQADAEMVKDPIRPGGVGDIGVRMIIAPQELNSDYTRDELVSLAQQAASQVNVLVIVPSNAAAEVWKNGGATFLDRTNLYEGIEKLRSGHHGITVIANKYDGIDLPGESCQLLIIDGLPQHSGLIQGVNATAIEGTRSSKIGVVQTLEQGMGRGVRSGEDFCGVVLFGNRIVRTINLPETFNHFTEATQIQFEVARKLAKQLAESEGKVDNSKLMEALRFSFEKNEDWRTGSKREIARADSYKVAFIEEFLPETRRAFDLARSKRWEPAFDVLQGCADKLEDGLEKGYVLYQAAEVMYHLDVKKSFDILRSASTLNRHLVKPPEGLEYKRISAPMDQAAACQAYMVQFIDGNQLTHWLRILIDDLDWNPQQTKRFEQAVQDLGRFLGFGSDRPEQDTRKGPDNLWATQADLFLVIECKSGAISNEISKGDLNQLSSSMNWFGEHYPPNSKALPIIIHPSHNRASDAFPPTGALVIDRAKLASLRTELLSYGRALASNENYKNINKISERLQQHGLFHKIFIERFTCKIK